jgi:hypothetical protein
VPLRALLVGVGDYPHPSLRPLQGPRADVAALRDALVDQLGVPAEDVRTLVDGEATRAGIAQAFQDHLVAHGRAWRAAGRAGPPPAYLFYFSGHGSQARDPTGVEPDGLDETLVPYDAREDDVFDIKDHEVGAWLAALPGDNVTVVLDCCHSGSGTREARDDEAAAVRSAPVDLRPQPVTRPGALGATRGVSVDGGSGHVLLAACSDHQEAYEIATSAGTRRGAFTLALVPQLVALAGDGEVTYRQLHQSVRFEVNRLRPTQTPQCEGDVDRVVFSPRRVDRHDLAIAHVLGTRRERIWLDAGELHGVTAGSRLVLGRDGAAGTVTVEHLEPVRCAGPLADAEGWPKPGTPAHLGHLDLGPARLRVRASGPAAELLLAASLDGLLAGAVRATEREDEADVALTGQPGGGFVVHDAAGLEVVSAPDAGAVQATLAHLARVEHLRRLERPTFGPDIDGEVRLAVRGLAVDPATGESGSADLPQDAGAVLVDDGQRIVVEVVNGCPVPLYVGVVLFAGWEVTVVHPTVVGAEERLLPGRTLALGTGTDALTATVPAGSEVTRDDLRVLAATHATSFEALAATPPPASWQPSRALPAPTAGPPGRPPAALPPRGTAAVASRWTSRTVTLVTRRGGHVRG